MNRKMITSEQMLAVAHLTGKQTETTWPSSHYTSSTYSEVTTAPTVALFYFSTFPTLTRQIFTDTTCSLVT